MIEYLPFEKRTVDTQYEDLLRAIFSQGKNKKPIHATLAENINKDHSYARELTGKVCCLEYNLENGFPIFGCRDVRKLVTGAIGELAAFLNGARTLEELKSYGCPEQFWKDWVTKKKCADFGLKEGDLGDGSYGPALRAFPTPDFQFQNQESCFDQLSALNDLMMLSPMSRTILLTTWIPHLALGSNIQGFPRKVVVAPCHGSFFHVHVFPELREMQVTCVQRSADAPVGLQFNIAQWCTLGLVLSMIHGLKFTKYTYFVSSAQIYDIQFESVHKILGREPRKFPTVTLRVPLGTS
jgi:thymidylate synthase